MRPVMDDGRLVESSSPPLPEAPADAPLVYVTMGTAFNDPAHLANVLAALDGLHVRVLVTVGPHADPGVLGAQPENVRVASYVSQALVLPHCDVVVSHAGSGTTLATLTLGVPQLCLPQGADQFLNADAIALSGAGISLAPSDQSVVAVRGAIADLLSNTSFREAAGGAQASIAAMPAPDEVVAVLETMVGTSAVGAVSHTTPASDR